MCDIKVAGRRCPYLSFQVVRAIRDQDCTIGERSNKCEASLLPKPLLPNDCKLAYAWPCLRLISKGGNAVTGFCPVMAGTSRLATPGHLCLLCRTTIWLGFSIVHLDSLCDTFLVIGLACGSMVTAAIQ
jgi:hypothetical protein